MRKASKPVAEMTRDELTDAVTACGYFDGLVWSMRNHGYRPTLRGYPAGAKANRVRVKQQQRWNQMVNRLRAEVVKAGFGYFDGSQHVPPLAEQVHQVRGVGK